MMLRSLFGLDGLVCLVFGYDYLGYMDYVYTMLFLNMDLNMYMIWSDFVINRVIRELLRISYFVLKVSSLDFFMSD